MKTKTVVLGAAMLTCLLGWTIVRSQLAVAPLRSFLITETMASATGAPLRDIVTRSIAVRADGSYILITHVPNVEPKTAYVRDIYDMQTGLRTTVEELSKSTETRKMNHHMMSLKRVVPAASCGGKAAGEILGQPVEYIRTSETIPEPDEGLVVQRTRTRWAATDLGCTNLREEIVIKEAPVKTPNDWTTVGDTIHQAVEILFQPVDRFFEIPTDFTERTPTEVYQELHRLYPQRFDSVQLPGPDAAYKKGHEEVTR